MNLTKVQKYGIAGGLIAFILFMSARNSGILEGMTSNSEPIAGLTDEWIRLVVEEKNPEKIYELFCEDGILVGTVSQVERRKEDIKKYFDYFAKLPDLEVVKKQYSIEEVEQNVYVNNAWITWHWKGLEEPIVARMTFIFKKKEDGKWCLFELHSSALPDLNEELKEVSGKS